MVGLRESWCFCNGGGKSERMKGAIFSGKGPAMARIASAGTGFLIHRNLLLTTHVNLPSVAAAEAAEIRLQNAVAASLFPHRFFITSSVLDLTIVGLDAVDESAQLQPHYLKTCSKPNLDLGSVVYLLGYTEKKELMVGEGKVVIATDNLIKLSTDGVTWSPGSAGFDVHGNLAFMVCDPMKLATSPNTKSSSTSPPSSSSWKRDHLTQFGIPIPIICDWLSQHWEGNLDELNKPKLPLMRLMSSGQRSDHSCTSFTMRQVFKPREAENDEQTSSDTLSKLQEQPGPSSFAIVNPPEDRVQGIPTPEIFESPNLMPVSTKKKETTTIQLLDINFPPKITKSALSLLPAIKVPRPSDETYVKEPPLEEGFNDNGHVKEAPLEEGFNDSGHVKEPPLEEGFNDRGHSSPVADAEISSMGSISVEQSEAQLIASPIEALDMYNDYSSEGETTMYSAETAESRNYPSPREGRFQRVGRSQSCVNYNRWGPVHKNPATRRTSQERKVCSQGAASQRSNVYSPTVSSIMKRRNSTEQPNRVRPSAVHSSPKWVS